MNAKFWGGVFGFSISWIICEAILLAVQGKSNEFSPLSTRDFLVIGIFVKLLQVEESLKRRD
jgi:cell division protein FtsX